MSTLKQSITREYTQRQSYRLRKSIAYPRVEYPEVIGLEVRIPSGQETGWHTHSMPGYAYVISGTITLEYEKGITKQFKHGDAFAEVVNVSHNGRNNGSEDVVLIVFFTGEKGVSDNQTSTA